MASVSRLLCRCLDPPTTSSVEPQGCKIIVGPIAWAPSMLDCHVGGEGARAWWRVCISGCMNNCKEAEASAITVGLKELYNVF